MGILDLLPAEAHESALKGFQDVVENGHSMVELEFKHKTGLTGFWSVEAVRLSSNKYLGFASDISKRKQSDQENLRLQGHLHHSQKMESLGSLAGGVAHDMNNVLGAILGLASANIEAQPMGSPAQHAFKTIIKATERGGKMVKGLLSFARQSPAEEKDLDLNAILLEEVHLLERTTLSRVNLETDLASNLRCIRGDANALAHAFMNLCVNAKDAMHDGGTLTLRTRNLDSNWIQVEVEDTGSGMSNDVLARALDPFFTTKEVGKGTGLGLSMVYSTVKAHQGLIDIESELGRGTCVKMRFPISESMIQTADASATIPLKTPFRTLSVLVVDDDELIQSTLVAMLDILNHSISSAWSGEEALVRLESGLVPDAVILDMNMPGLGGDGTLPRLRALFPALPVFLATGRVDESALNLTRKYPHVTLLSKPFSMLELQQCLSTLG
jgi:signal transduction histidine kinase